MFMTNFVLGGIVWHLERAKDELSSDKSCDDTRSILNKIIQDLEEFLMEDINEFAKESK